MKSNKQKIIEKKKLLEETHEKLFSVEEKRIKNEITRDTYERWYSTFNSTILNLKGAIKRLGQNHGRALTILKKNLEMLTDVRYLYSKADIFQKREFVNLVFDSNLYYQGGIYRTPTTMNIFSHNSLIMKEKGYLIYEKKGIILQSSLPVEPQGIEPWSKHIRRKPSTCLVLHSLSGKGRSKTNQPDP